MNIKKLDDLIREHARAAFKAKVVEAISAVDALIKNPTAVKSVKYEGKDIIDRKLLEVLQQHILDTQSFREEEEAVAAVVDEVIEKGTISFPFLDKG